MATPADLIMKIKHKIIRDIVAAFQVDHGMFEIDFHADAIHALNQIDWFVLVQQNAAAQEIAESVALQIEALSEEGKVVGLPDGIQWDAALIQKALQQGGYAAIAGKQFLTEAVLAKIEEPLQTVLRTRGDDLSNANSVGIERFNEWLKNPANLPIDSEILTTQISLLAQIKPMKLLSGVDAPALTVTKAELQAISKHAMAPALAVERYTEIQHAVSGSHPTLAAQLQAQQANIVAYLTTNPLVDAATTIRALKTASDMPHLRTALEPLIGSNSDETANWQDVSLQPLLEETRFGFLLETAKNHPQLLAALNANAVVIKNKLAIAPSDAANYVDIAAQSTMLLEGATSFEAIKTGLGELGLAAPAVNLADLAAEIVAENVLLALPGVIPADNASIKKLLENQNIQNLIAANIKKLIKNPATANANDKINFLQALIETQLVALQAQVKSKEGLEKAICELLGVATVASTPEAAFIKQCIDEIYFKAAAATYKPEALNPLQERLPEFVACLDKNLELKAGVLSKTAGWNAVDWKLRTGFLTDVLFKYSFSKPEYDAIRTDPVMQKFFQRDVLTAQDLSDNAIDTFIGEARLSRWLANKAPDFAKFLKALKLRAVNGLSDTTAWAEMARGLGAIPDAATAKKKLENCWQQCRQATQPAELWNALTNAALIAVDYVMPATLDNATAKHAQAEMALMKFEKFNPALVRWFRENAVLWKHITQALEELNTSEEMFNTLRGISYLLQHPKMQAPATKRFIFTEKLNEVVENLLPNQQRATAMFGGVLPAINFGIDPNVLKAVLSDAQLEMLTQSAAAATAVTIMSDSNLNAHPLFSPQLDNIAKRFKESRSPTGILFKDSLGSQLKQHATQDDELYGNLMPLIRQVKSIAQGTNKEEAFAACLHAAVAIDSVRRYFAEKLQNLRYQFEASRNMVVQVAALPNMEDFKAAEEALQKDLIGSINGYVRALQTIDSHMEQLDAILERQKVQFAAKRGKIMMPKSLADETVVIGAGDDVVMHINHLKNQAATRQGGLTAYAGGTRPQQENELQVGSQLVTVTNNITGTSSTSKQHAFSRSMTNTGSGFVAAIHEIPTGGGISGWFTGTMQARTKALDVWTDELLRMSDEDYHAGYKEKRLGAGILFLDLADKDLLKDALVLLAAKNKLRAYNGERVVAIEYNVCFENVKELNKKITKTFEDLKQQQTHSVKPPATKHVQELQEKTKALKEASETIELATGNRPGRAA